tara:strand:+ start:255 stop:506 length:252 start_codon:yes stop_codon:yes gene_type:complete
MRINVAMQILKRLEPRRIKIDISLVAILLCHLDDVGQTLGHKIAHLLNFIVGQHLLEFGDAKISMAADLALVRLLHSGDEAQH